MIMKIGLLDIDGHHFPNFALMRLSAWHKAHGDIVEWADALFGEYDRVYKSKIFTFTPDDNTPWQSEVVCGGYGYDILKKKIKQDMRATKLYGIFYIFDTISLMLMNRS